MFYDTGTRHEKALITNIPRVRDSEETILGPRVMATNTFSVNKGMSEHKNMMAFRGCYGRLHELRSLAPNDKMIALTATATKLTKATILSILLMDKPFEIQNVRTSQMLHI